MTRTKTYLLAFSLLALLLAGTAGGYSLLRTIYITPGHCVTVASTRVCARKSSLKTKTPPAKTTGKAENKGFVVETLQIKDDGLGDIGGIARLKNTTASTLTITFTFTFFTTGGSVVGTATGDANDVAPGETVTVNLLSQDPISRIPSSFKYQFQIDAEF